MVECSDCEFEAKSPAGLASHRRSKHREAAGALGATAGANRSAVDATLAELDRIGRFEAVDAARVQAVRSIADALDLNPFNSQMWREYREALEALTDDGDDDGGIEALLRELSGAEVRDTPSA